MFTSAKLHNLEISTSDHAPILMVMVPTVGHNFVKRFWFENAWLRASLYYQIVKDSWEICGADDVMYKVQFFGEKLADWGFSSLLRSYEQSGLLTGCKIARGAPVISHMLFVDASYIYCKATEEEAYNVKELLRTYEMKMATTWVFLVRLGGIRMLSLAFLRIGFRREFKVGKGRILSRAGNEVLLKSIAHALPNYAMNVFLLPLDTWKQYWRLLVNDDSLVSRLYKAKYYAHGNLFSAELGDNPSFIWRSILEDKDLVHSCAQRTVANGENVSILVDPWLPHSSNNYVVTRHPALVNKSVSCLFQVDTRTWDEDIVRTFLFHVIRTSFCPFILVIQP
ncbi:uncharacterized protein LOC133031409 [Cannabis sativa]|uniref:uncharacterized protein LOC133031409 n=1 Tax=Cannabis sativa TaxID=3483 RepID=UPI0029CA8AF6|nr:uncharacterized protein LOC133031409 [Cannabis sativa]